MLGFAAGEAAERRSDARVLLLSLAFMATGGFLRLHAIGTHQVLFPSEHSGFKVAISVGLLVGAVSRAGPRSSTSALTSGRGRSATAATPRRHARDGGVVHADRPGPPAARRPARRGRAQQSARGPRLRRHVVYAISAYRYWRLFRRHRKLLLGAVTACFVLLAEAMVGVAVTGERSWHASWWEWHGLIVSGYLVVGIAAQREWRDERFRDLYLPTTRERTQEVSVLFGDLAGFTTFSERSTPTDVAKVLDAYWSVAAPLIPGASAAR